MSSRSRNKTTNVFDLSGLRRSLSASNGNKSTTQSRAVDCVLYPSPINPKNVPVASDPTSYVSICNNNIRAEIHGFYTSQITPGRNNWRDRFEAYEIHADPPKDSTVDIRSMRVYGSDHWCMPSEQIERLNKNLVLYTNRIGLIHCTAAPSPGGVVATIQLGAPFLDRTTSSSSANVIHNVGYVGSYIRDLEATYQVLDNTVTPACNMFIRSVASPHKQREPFGYLTSLALDSNKVPYNATQERCIRSMHTNVEGIQGPPGTGKSTTIFHLTNSIIPKDHLAVVTCVQNKAVDALAEKMAESSETLPFIVVGNVDLIGVTAQMYLLKQQVDRSPDVVAAKREVDMWTGRCNLFTRLKSVLIDLMDGDADFRKNMRTLHESKKLVYNPYRPWDRLWTAYVLKHRGVEEDVLQYEEQKEKAMSHLARTKFLREREIVKSARAVLCTIDTTGRLFVQETMEEIMSPMPKVAIIDEAGTVPEYKLPLLALMGCVALICIGDQKQLAPFTHCDTKDDTYNAGVFQRLSKSVDVPMLVEQYRMHKSIAEYVSDMFYQKKLVTPTEVAQVRSVGRGVVWMDYSLVQGEVLVGRSKSPINEKEVDQVFEILLGPMRELMKAGKSIMVITFYKQQFFEMIDKAKLYDMMKTEDDKETKKKRDVMCGIYKNLRFTTVDAAQGSEADVVILSCVRCNPEKKIGFLDNANRACVAVSRARETLFVVGNSRTLSVCPIWKRLHNAADAREAF